MIAPSTRAYYRQHSRTTDPGSHRDLLVGLPESIPDLVQVVQGLVADKDSLDLHGVNPDKLRLADTRYFDAILPQIMALDARPLTEPREPANLFVGSCRDYALVLCAFLRHFAVPARLRCGFARYFDVNRDFFDDHWVCEYWSGDDQRWILVDANVDPIVRQKHLISVNTLDLPRDEFVVAGDAWRLVRSGQVNADRFGVSSIGIQGLWFVRGSVVRDLAALNRVEALPWDYWSLADDQDGFPPEQLEVLDRAAGAISAATDLESLQTLYRQGQFRMANRIKSYSPFSGLTEVSVAT
jgi:hypothetical protein